MAVKELELVSYDGNDDVFQANVLRTVEKITIDQCNEIFFSWALQKNSNEEWSSWSTRHKRL